MDFLYRHDTNGFCHFGLHFLSQLWIQNFRSTTPLFIKNFLLVDMLSCDWPINCTWIQLWKVADAWWIIGEIRSSSNDHQSLIANSFFHASTSIEWFDLKKSSFHHHFDHFEGFCQTNIKDFSFWWLSLLITPLICHRKPSYLSAIHKVIERKRMTIKMNRAKLGLIRRAQVTFCSQG